MMIRIHQNLSRSSTTCTVLVFAVFFFASSFSVDASTPHHLEHFVRVGILNAIAMPIRLTFELLHIVIDIHSYSAPTLTSICAVTSIFSPDNNSIQAVLRSPLISINQKHKPTTPFRPTLTHLFAFARCPDDDSSDICSKGESETKRGSNVGAYSNSRIHRRTAFCQVGLRLIKNFATFSKAGNYHQPRSASRIVTVLPTTPAIAPALV
jgi:hypothetical protein